MNEPIIVEEEFCGGRTVKFLCPLPPPECSPNGRFHRSAKAAAIAAYRRDCGILAAQAFTALRRMGFTRATVKYVFRVGGRSFVDPRYIPRDNDNAIASIKALQDALVDGRLIPGDDSKTLTLAGVEFDHLPRKGGDGCGVYVILTEVLS